MASLGPTSRFCEVESKRITFGFALGRNLPIHPMQLATLEIESQNWPEIRAPILSKTKAPETQMPADGSRNPFIEPNLPVTTVNPEIYAPGGLFAL